MWPPTALAPVRLPGAGGRLHRGGGLVAGCGRSPQEYATTGYRSPGGSWDEPFDEVSPFGSSERHVLRIARGICARGRLVGSLVVRVMLDYRTLPFISSQSPYLESLRPNREVAPEGISGRDVEFVVYGWSRAPIFASGTRVWSLPDAVFQRLVTSRDPFWQTPEPADQTFRVPFPSAPGGISPPPQPVPEI